MPEKPKYMFDKTVEKEKVVANNKAIKKNQEEVSKIQAERKENSARHRKASGVVRPRVN